MTSPKQLVLAVVLVLGWIPTDSRAAEYSRFSVPKDEVDPEYPKTIAKDGWFRVWRTGVDAVLAHPRNGKIYFFKKDEYARYDLDSDRVDPGYPKKIAIDGWFRVWTSGIDAALAHPRNGKIYFFKKDEYARYDLDSDRVDPGYPKKIGTDGWLNLIAPVTAAVNVGSKRIYFFHPDGLVARIYPFPGRADDLAVGHYWRRTKKVHGSGTQAQGYDLTAIRFDADSGQWTSRRPGVEANTNEARIVYGLPVYAIADGEVTRCWRNAPENPRPGREHPAVGTGMPFGGNQLWVDLGNGQRMLYAHFQPGTIPTELCPFSKRLFEKSSEADIPPGNRPRIRKGQFLGRIGNSGQSSGPHLHLHVDDGADAVAFKFERLWAKSTEPQRDKPADWKRLEDARLPPGPIAILPDFAEIPVQIVGSGSKKCLDVKAGSTEDRTPAILFRCHGGVNQQWSFHNGQIRSALGKCLDVKGGEAEDRTPVILFRCHDGKNQQWTFQNGQIRSDLGLCLDVKGGETEDRTPIILFRCHGGENQEWVLE